MKLPALGCETKKFPSLYGINKYFSAQKRHNFVVVCFKGTKLYVTTKQKEMELPIYAAFQMMQPWRLKLSLNQ